MSRVVSRMRILEGVLYTIYFLCGIISAGGIVYIVMWLEALRKGWLV